MRTLICTLTFLDGKTVTAKAASRSKEDVVPVTYAGDASRLKPFAEKGTLGFLEWYFQSCASNTAADIIMKLEGEFED